MNISRIRTRVIIDDIASVVRNWEMYAEKTFISEVIIKEIGREHFRLE